MTNINVLSARPSTVLGWGTVTFEKPYVGSMHEIFQGMIQTPNIAPPGAAGATLNGMFKFGLVVGANVGMFSFGRHMLFMKLAEAVEEAERLGNVTYKDVLALSTTPDKKNFLVRYRIMGRKARLLCHAHGIDTSDVKDVRSHDIKATQRLAFMLKRKLDAHGVKGNFSLNGITKPDGIDYTVPPGMEGGE